jgi:hypothetical protein
MRKVLTITAAALAASVVTAMPADAKTMSFFSKAAGSTFVDPSGNPIQREPAAGDITYGTDEDYVGNHAKHAKKATASDHIACTLTKVDPANNEIDALCDVQIALPGGMLLADRQTLNFATSKFSFHLTGGTGKYARVKKGTVTVTQLGGPTDDSDLTIKF